MKAFILIYIVLLNVNAWVFYGQDLRIKHSDLPFAIPVVVKPSDGDKIIYQWLENDQIIDQANDFVYIIPHDKAVGTYRYIHQVKGVDCSEWVSSNSFTVEIYQDEHEKDYSLKRPIVANFSPQKELIGYLEDLRTLIDQTKKQLDISIYSMDNYDIYLALSRAAKRGVQIRMLYEGALKDRNQQYGTASHRLEEIGVDVKYVNKTNHHKFVIADQEFLMTSSGNWNAKTNWQHEESSLLITDTDLVLEYRAEFELLWNHSREFGKSYTYKVIKSDSLLTQVQENPIAKAYFTSSNYKISHSVNHGPTFSKNGNRQALADQLVLRIQQSKKSIKIASNYLRSRPICEALITKKIENPDFDIKVFTDQNEYITDYTNQYQIAERDSCYIHANTPAKKRDCLEKNFMYSYNLIEAGIDLRFKCYSYKWHYSTAKTMHHKYAIFDDDVVAVGSYNYSYNSETNCMENLVVFDRNASPATVDQYVTNFNDIWELGRRENFYEDILVHLASPSRYVPLLFTPMSLEHREYAHLKQQLENAVPLVKDAYFKQQGQFYSSYFKGVYLQYGGGDQQITAVNDEIDGLFTIDYSYDKKKKLVSINFDFPTGIPYTKTFQYDNHSNLIGVKTPYINLDLTFENKQLKQLNTSGASYHWAHKGLNNNEREISYNTTTRPNYLVSTWTNFDFPKSVRDFEGRNLNWEFDDQHELIALKDTDRNLQYETTSTGMSVRATDGNQVDLQLFSLNKYLITTLGTVATTVSYHNQETGDSDRSLAIDIHSTRVTSGPGSMAHINYVLDPYGRVIKAFDLTISRKPLTGEIKTIKQGSLEEVRTYSAWNLLTEQSVKFGNKEIYRAKYQYDALFRIKQLDESLGGTTDQIRYTYTAKGELHQVVKNGLVYEEYSYDDLGNRLQVKSGATLYTYTNNDYNQTTGYSWMQSGIMKRKKFKYNLAGQLQSHSNITNNTLTSSRQYDYDVWGNLKEVAWAAQKRTYYYDVFNRATVTYQNSVAKHKFVYGIANVPLAMLNENDRIISTYLYSDQHTPVLMRKGSRDYYLITDIRGSLRMVVQLDNGEIQQEITYDAFGKVITDTHPGFTPFGFTAGLYDYRTGLVRLGFRDYFAEMGSWTTENPLGFLSGHFNDYIYALNDPINYKTTAGIQTRYIHKSTDGIHSNWNSLLTLVMGTAGKGMIWDGLESLWVKDQLSFDGKTARNMKNKIYPMTGNPAMHQKIHAFYQSKFTYEIPYTIFNWVQ